MWNYQLNSEDLWFQSEALKIDKIDFKRLCPDEIQLPYNDEHKKYECAVMDPSITVQNSLSLSYGKVKGHLIVKPAESCHECTNFDKNSIGMIKKDCSSGSVITGARYLAYHDGKYESMHIGGIEFICSNPQQTWTDTSNSETETHFLQIDNEYSGNYAWSKFYICPSGYYLNLAINDLTKCDYHEDDLSFLSCILGGHEEWWSAYTVSHITFKCIKYEDYPFIGCFKDCPWVMDPRHYVYKHDVTTSECAKDCKGSKYFSIQLRNQCWCDNDESFTKYGYSPDCNLPYGGYCAH
eukprot:UN02055